MTKAWMEAWWSEWGVHSDATRLGQFYRATYWFKGMPIDSVQFLGTDHRKLSTPRAEYLALTPSAEWQDLCALDGTPWTEGVLRDLVEEGATARTIRRWTEERGYLLRVIHLDTAYQVYVQTTFDEYLKTLGKNTRLKLYNRRRRLHELGEVGEAFWSPKPFLDLLNLFHCRRWGRPCFNAESMRFHQRFLENIEAEGGVPELSVLTLDGNPVSALYNVVFDGRVYNIQSGFAEELGKGIAVGTLHLGYALERAFAAPGIEWFDLLAGEGKNTNYKSHLATHCTPLVSVMVVRNLFYQVMYRLQDLWKRQSCSRNLRNIVKYTP